MTHITHAEAQTKWCPEARIAIGSATFNRTNALGIVDQACTCIGSACMAWRWHDPETKWFGKPQLDDRGQLPEGWEWNDQASQDKGSGVASRIMPQATRLGFCGKFEPRVATVEHD